MSKYARISTGSILLVCVAAAAAQGDVQRVVVQPATCSPPCGTTINVAWAIACEPCSLHCEATQINVSADQPDAHAMAAAIVCAINASPAPALWRAENVSDTSNAQFDVYFAGNQVLCLSDGVRLGHVCAFCPEVVVGNPAWRFTASGSPSLLEDCNCNGIEDAAELSPTTDCNANNVLDECEIAARVLFETQQRRIVGDLPKWLAAADINADGWIDCASADSISKTASVLINDGPATPDCTSFVSAVAYSVAPDAPTSVAFGQAYGPGNAPPDLVISTNVDAERGQVRILANNGAGAFSLVVSLNIPQNSISVRVGDLNSDNLPDLF